MTKVKVFRDPVHNLITIADDSKVILQLIDTPEFQRLRRIKQLGLCSYTYHGAEHSRFSHSLGVFHFVQRMVNALRRCYRHSKYAKKLEKYALKVKVAALLHDLGHGPFSHVFENVCGDGKKHDDWTADIIKNPEGCIREVLEYNKINFEEIIKIIKRRHQEPFVNDIISSQIDADKMDYLLRDSLMTGAKYGNFDPDWILHTLRIGDVQMRDENGNLLIVQKLCIDGTKGVHSIEEYILARLFMYMQVYFHKTTRAYEALFINILNFANHIKGQGGTLPSGTPELIDKVITQKGRVEIKEYLILDDILFLNTLKDWSRYDGDDNDLKELAKMAQKLLFRGVPYKFIDLSEDTKKYRNAISLIGSLNDNPLRFYCYLDEAEDMPYKGILYEIKAKRGVEESYSLPIFIIEKDGESPIPIESSPNSILKSLEGVTFKKMRFFYDRDKKDEFEVLMKRFKIIQQKGGESYEKFI